MPDCRSADRGTDRPAASSFNLRESDQVADKNGAIGVLAGRKGDGVPVGRPGRINVVDAGGLPDRAQLEPSAFMM
jgi:hypothetical protein